MPDIPYGSVVRFLHGSRNSLTLLRIVMPPPNDREDEAGKIWIQKVGDNLNPDPHIHLQYNYTSEYTIVENSNNMTKNRKRKILRRRAKET